MSLWDSFRSTLGVGIKKISGGSPYLSEEERQKEQQLTETIRSTIDGLNKEIDSSLQGRLAKAATKSTADFLLKYVAKPFNEKVYSPLMRTVSTGALLSDLDSPLYKKGQFEEGFQFKDIKLAYERSKKVSAFQALTKSDLVPIINPLSQVFLSKASSGKIDLETVNLWNDQSIKQNFVDNAVSRIICCLTLFNKVDIL